MTNKDGDDIYKEIESMASEPLRVIGFAYCDINIDDWNNNFSEEGENHHRFD